MKNKYFWLGRASRYIEDLRNTMGLLAAAMVRNDNDREGETMKNEKTSKRVGKVAGRILHIFEQFEIPASEEVEAGGVKIGTVSDIKALAASALTQTPDKKAVKKAKKTKKGARR